MRALLLVAFTSLVGTSAIADDTAWRFQCDGTDPWLLAELDEAMRTGVGYQETWDETICNDGNVVLGEGVRGRSKARVPNEATTSPDAAAASAEPTAAPVAPGATTTTAASLSGQAPRLAKPALTPLEQRMQDQYFAIFIPVFTLFLLGLSGLAAAIVVFFIRRRKQHVVVVGCPSCRTEIPFVVGEMPTLFCPACGNACRVDVALTNGHAVAAAVPL
jgi:hypothetical protein